MGILNVRNLPDAVLSRLKVRAAEHNRSMEAEARAILTAAVSEASAAPYDVGSSLRGLALRLGGAGGGVVDEFLAERRAEARRENRAASPSTGRKQSRKR